MYPYSFLSAVVVFIIFSNIAVIKSTEFYGSGIYHDITKLISDYRSTDADLKSVVESFLKYIISNENPGPVLIYYEYDFYYGVWPAQKAINRIRQVMSNSKLLINIVDRIYISNYTDVRRFVEDRYSNLLVTVAGHASITNGLSLEIFNVKNDCNFNSNNTRRTAPNNNSIIQEIKRLLRLKGYTLKIGYTVNFRHLNCPEHIHYLKDADYFIVDYTLKRNDNIFIESYGAFKTNMKNLIASALNSLHNFSRPVFHKISLNTDLEVDDTANKQCVGRENLETHTKQLIDMASRMLDNMERGYMSRYKFLFIEFCQQWATEEQNLIVILKHTPAITSSNVFASEYTTENLVIPQIPKLPVNKLDKTGMFSVGFLLEEMASSGFNTIMINGGTWQELINKGIPYYNCLDERCRPQNVLYLNDMNNSFSSQFLFENPIEKWLSGGGMNLTGLVFSRYYKENIDFDWSQGVARLRTAARFKRENAARIETGCTEWTDIFADVLNKGTYDTICDALELRRIIGCHSLGHASNIIVWRGELKLKSNDVTSFTENTMKKLDAVILGRQILQNRNGAEKRVFLRFKVTYEGGSARVTNPIYCTTGMANISRLYEILLTWAQIHDFPIILEPVGSLVAYDNPISWQRLQTTGTGQIHNLMEMFPIFIRRNYNQSKVFANWTRGMYPCITKSTDKKSVEVVSFHNKYVGTTISLNIRSDTDLLSSRELKTILLFALIKFMTVEVILRNRAELQILYNTVTRNDFEENLKINNISERNIYLSMPASLSSEDSGRALLLAFDLPAYGFNINIHYLASGEFGIEYETFLNHNKTSVGIVLESCTDNTMEVLTSNFLKNINISRLDYLICDTNVIPAHNNDDVTTQDTLNIHLYLKKLFQYFLPNLKEIHFRLHPILYGNTFDSQSQNLLLFLTDLNNYANSHDIHYFLLPALPPQSKTNEASFWSSKNYNYLDDISSFVERQARFLRTASRTPKLVKDIDTSVTLAEQYGYWENLSGIFNVTSSTPESTSVSEITINYITTEEIANSTELVIIQPEKHPDNIYLAVGISSVVFLIVLTLIAIKIRRHYDVTIECTYNCSSCRRNRRNTPDATDDNLKVDFQNINKKGRTTTISIYHPELPPEPNVKIHQDIAEGLPQPDVKNCYELSKESIIIQYDKILGSGQFGIVYCAKLIDYPADVAVKMLHEDSSSQSLKGMLSEIKLLSSIGTHQNVVQFIGCYTAEIQSGILWIVTELCSNGSLLSFLRDVEAERVTEKLTLRKLIEFSLGVAKGMDYIGVKNIIHGDLSTRNVLLDENYNCKIGDFGLSRKLYNYELYVKTSQEPLPWRWMAYESLKKLEFSVQSDVWSYGVTLWEIFTLGDIPYPGLSWSAKFVNELKNGLRLDDSTYGTDEINAIILKCWEIKAKERPSFGEMVTFFENQLQRNDIESVIV